MKYAVYAVATLFILIPLFAMLKKGKFFKNLFISAFQGGASLLAIKALGLLTGVVLPLNGFTLTAAAILGIPSCIAMLMLKLIFKQ